MQELTAELLREFFYQMHGISSSILTDFIHFYMRGGAGEGSRGVQQGGGDQANGCDGDDLHGPGGLHGLHRSNHGNEDLLSIMLL